MDLKRKLEAAAKRIIEAPNDVEDLLHCSGPNTSNATVAPWLLAPPRAPHPDMESSSEDDGGGWL